MRIAYLNDTSRCFVDRCGCRFARDGATHIPTVSTCTSHLPVMQLAQACDDCGWVGNAPWKRDEYLMCPVHGAAWHAATMHFDIDRPSR